MWGFEAVLAVLVREWKVGKWWLQQLVQLDSTALIWYTNASETDQSASAWPIRNVILSIQDGDNDYGGMGWILGWYSGCVNILYMSIHEKQNGAFMFSSCLPLRSRLSFWCWWIKAQTGNRIQRKDTQGLPYIVEQLSTPLIHLIRFSQLSFFFFLPFREYRGFKFATACPSWHSEPGASPSISAKRGKKN